MLHVTFVRLTEVGEGGWDRGGGGWEGGSQGMGVRGGRRCI